MLRFNQLLSAVKDSLKSMDLAIRGLVVMSSDLEAAYQAIAINRVPAMWARVSYPSLKPLASYLEDLYQRLDMLQSWCVPNDLLLRSLPGGQCMKGSRSGYTISTQDAFGRQNSQVGGKGN
jgi:hypothetical protein